jgi:uncharacterized repeat protein (TIGR01451 family)
MQSMKKRFCHLMIALSLFSFFITPRASAQPPEPQDPRAAGLSEGTDLLIEDIIIHKSPEIFEPFRIVLQQSASTGQVEQTQNAFLSMAEAVLGRTPEVLARDITRQNSITLKLLKSEAKKLMALPNVMTVSSLATSAEQTTSQIQPNTSTDTSREAPLPVTHTISQDLANPGGLLTYTITIPSNRTGTDLSYAITDTLPAGITFIPESLWLTGSDIPAAYDDLSRTVSWSGIVPNFESLYQMSDNTTNPDYCKMPLFDGGYIDILSRYGTGTYETVYGDQIAFKLGILGEGTQFFGDVIPYLPYFTDDGYVLMNEEDNYVHPINYALNTTFPNPTTPNGLLSVWWRDMLIDYDAALNKGVTARYFTDAFLVEFDDLEEFWHGYTMDFEVFTWRTPDPEIGWPDIIFAYDNVTGDWYDDPIYNPVITGSIGIENADGSTGHTHTYNSTVPQNGDIVCFDYYEVGRDPVVITFDVTVDLEQVPGTVITNTVNHTIDAVPQTPLSKSFMVNDTPVAYPQNLSIDEDTPIQIFLDGTDTYPEGETLEYDITLNPPHGSLTGSPSSPIYTPDLNYDDTDWFYYTVSDGIATSEPALITIEITPVNDAPYFILPVPNQTVDEGGSFNKINLGYYINDPDDADDVLGFSFTGNTDLNIEIDAEHFATMTIPHEDWFGSETITFRATDPEGAFGEQAVTFTVNPINDAPIAVDDELGSEINLPLAINELDLIANDLDIDNLLSELFIVNIDNFVGGLVTRSDGVITFTPITNYIGLAGFDYTVSDGLLTDVGRVDIMITDENNTAPTSVADTYDMNEYGLLSVETPGILSNDLDAENNVLRTVLVSSTTTGDLTLNIDGSFTYSPPPAYIGTDSFVYHVTDGILDGEEVIVTINVNELPTIEQTIPLSIGWNLVSFRLMPPPTTPIGDLLSSIDGNYTLVYAWDAAQAAWKLFDPNVPPYANDLGELTQAMGFWINMTTADDLVISGKPVERSEISLSPGWDLVGYPSIETMALPDAFSNNGVTQFSSVMAYHASDTLLQWKVFDPLAPIYFNTLQSLTPGWGYWIEVNSASTWMVTYDLP